MLNRRRVVAVWLLAITAMLGAAQAQTSPQTQPKPRRFLMWKATSPTATVYLVGSVHLGDQSMYPLPQEVETAFAAAMVLTVEINVKNVDQSQAVTLVQKYGLYGPDDNLTKHISAETAAALLEFCTKHNLPRAGMEQLKPWIVAITLAAASWQEAGADQSLGVDIHFINESKPPQRIDELESVEFQLRLFASATEDEQQALLSSALKQGDKSKDMVQRIQAAYSAGDPDALQKIMEEESDMGSKSLTKKLLDDRNVTMAAKVDEYLKGKDPVFVVVGAAHIVGDKGIAKLLRDKGYKVEQVTLQAK